MKPQSTVSCQVLPFNSENLGRLLSNHASALPQHIKEKQQFNYLSTYLSTKGLKALTIVVENNYHDADYFEDYAAYYLRCDYEYPRRCVRLHFFRITFNYTAFVEFLNGNRKTLNQEKLQEAYLGFIVVKPLPKTIIGRTCLKTLQTNNDQSRFPTLRRYYPTLFGIPLAVESLAFQEQDQSITTCATSALWSILQSTSVEFNHPTLTSVEIANIAADRAPNAPRQMPAKGLMEHQMEEVVRNVGLEPIWVSIKNEWLLKCIAYSYLRSRICILMIVRLYDTSFTPAKKIGKHAIAITGYRKGLPKPIDYSLGFYAEASRIDKLYVHDDQVGPFSYMEFESKPLTILTNEETGETSEKNFSLTTQWSDSEGKIGNIRAVPELFLIPIPPMIRIPPQIILKAIAHFDVFIEKLQQNREILSESKRIKWDFYGSPVKYFKQDILSSRFPKEFPSYQILTQRMPLYVWRATAIINEKPILDLLFDVTAPEQAQSINQVIEYDRAFTTSLRNALKTSPVVRDNNWGPAERIIDWFRKNPRPSL